MRSIAYKEWLKLRSWMGFVLAAHLVFCAWLFLSMRYQFRIEHAEMIYYQANHIGRIFYDNLRYVPLSTGIAIGLVQFLPEVIRGRLRLSLHMPIDISFLLFSHLAIGLGSLLLFFVLDLAALLLTVRTFFPVAFATSALMTSLPWLLAGVAAYLGSALVLLEPARRHQAANLVIATGVVWLCFRASHYQAYDHALPGLLVFVFLLGPACLQAMQCFRNGES